MEFLETGDAIISDLKNAESGTRLAEMGEALAHTIHVAVQVFFEDAMKDPAYPKNAAAKAQINFLDALRKNL